MPEPKKIPMIMRWYDGMGRLMGRVDVNIEPTKVIELTGNPPVDAVRVVLDVALNPKTLCYSCGAELEGHMYFRGGNRVCRTCFRRRAVGP